jgi:hypothetical protein
MAPIIDKFTKWAASRPAWVANAYHRLVAEGKSPSRAKKLTVLVERATGSEFIPVPGTKRAKWFLPNAPGAVPISRYVRELKLHGISPEKLAAAHKTGERGYKTAASEEQAKKTIATRKFSRRFRRADKWLQNEAHEHTFVDRNGRWASELFRGRDLAIMQEYREDWQHALKFNDTRMLDRYKKIIIHNTSGEQIFPATDLETIRKFDEKLSTRMRNRFEREVNYLTKRDALAA